MRLPVDIARVKFSQPDDKPNMFSKAIYSHPLNVRNRDTLRQGRHFAVVWRPILESFKQLME